MSLPPNRSMLPVSTTVPVQSDGKPSLPSSTDGGSRTSSNSHRPMHSEDLLLRTWRSIAHSMALVTGKAEKVAAAADTDREAAMKELNEATIAFLRNHVDWGRSISYMEAKLEGKAAEMEAMQHYLRTHPSMGRKRKRIEESVKVD